MGPLNMDKALTSCSVEDVFLSCNELERVLDAFIVFPSLYFLDSE